MLMVHPSTPHDAPPQRRTPSEVRNNTEEKDYRFGGPHLHIKWAPKRMKREKAKMIRLRTIGLEKYKQAHTRARYRIKHSFPICISILFFLFLFLEASHLFQHSPTLCVCVCGRAGKARQIQFVCASSSSSTRSVCLSIRPNTTTIIDSGW